MDKFVCVRMVQVYGVDLSLFQFDGHQTWHVFLMNVDRTIYGRYGSRGGRDAMEDVSMEGFRKALEGALELHKNYPANKAALAGKTGPAQKWKTVETMPAVAGRYKPGDTSRQGCIHCHIIDDARVKSLYMTGQPVPDTALWSWPMPQALGLSLDPAERATAKAVAAGSPAEKAGFKAGDVIRTLEGQPPISIADVQWVLHNAPESGSLKAEVERGGGLVPLTLSLAKGWRRGLPYDWRDSTYGIRPGVFFEPVPDAERRSLGLAAGAPALRVKEMHIEWGSVGNRKIDAQKAGLQKGDVITAVDGAPVPSTESEMIAYAWSRKRPGQAIEYTVLRGGKQQKVSVAMP